MDKYDSINGESILIKFYNRLLNMINHFHKPINEIFAAENGKMNQLLFKKKLKQIGYTEQEINEENYISNYFLYDQSTESLININDIKKQLDIYQLNNSNNSHYPKNMDEIFTKINSIKTKMEKEILDFPRYIMVNICYQIKNNLYLNKLNLDYLSKKFLSKDLNKFGNVDKYYFFDVINQFYTSDENEQNILINELNNNPNANKKFIPYEKFCQLINDVNEDEIHNVKIEFNMKNNPYIVNMRKYIKNLSINIQNYWSYFNKGKVYMSKSEFIQFLKNGNLIDKNNFINDIEIEYIFYILSSNKQKLHFRDFEKAINEKEFSVKKDNLRISVDFQTTPSIENQNNKFNSTLITTRTSKSKILQKIETKQPDKNIRELCNSVINNIINEKKQNVEDFFKNADSFNKGYISMIKLKRLFKDDLKVKIDEDNIIDDFFNMIKEKETIEGNDIVKIEHLIKELRNYCDITNKSKSNNQENEEIKINRIKNYEKIILDLKKELSSKNNKINELENKISQLENEKSIFMEKEKNNFNIYDELLKEKEKECNKLKDIIININIDNNDLKTKYKKLKKEFESLQKQINEMNRNFNIMCEKYKSNKRYNNK